MKYILQLFLLHLKQISSRQNLAVIILTLVPMLYCTFSGISDFKKKPESIHRFKEIERKSFEKTVTYQMYSRSGIKQLFIPSATSILFKKSPIPPYLLAHFDSTIKLDISESFKGKASSPERVHGTIDFSSIFLSVFILWGMYMGYASFLNDEFLRLRTSSIGFRRIFFLSLLIKFVLISLIFSILYFSQVVIIQFSGIVFNSTDWAGLMVFFYSSILIILFFFLVGVCIGNIRHGFSAAFALIISWIFFVYLIPVAISSTADNDWPTMISDYDNWLEKYDLLMEFEKKCFEEAGVLNLNNIEAERRFSELFTGKYFKEIESIEKSFKNNLKKNIRSYKNMSIWTPVTFHSDVMAEAGSMGYRNLLLFYDLSQELQREFMFFYTDRYFFRDHNVMVNFIKGDENIYVAKSFVAKNYGLGIILTAFYCILLVQVSYFLTKRRIFPKVKPDVRFSDIRINFEPGKQYSVYVYNQGLLKFLINSFIGDSEYVTPKVFFGDTPCGHNNKKNILYLPNPGNLPGEITTVSFINTVSVELGLMPSRIAEIKDAADKKTLAMPLRKLEKLEIARLLLELARSKEFDIYLFCDFVRGIDSDDIEELAESARTLRDRGAIIVDILTDLNAWIDSDVIYRFKFKESKFRTICRTCEQPNE